MSEIKDKPMFVSFGFDDNGVAKSLSWASKLFKEYGSASFYLSTHFITLDGVKDEWRQLILNGHEVGNHTHSHKYGDEYSELQWEHEISKCTEILIKPYPTGIGLDKKDLLGFRTPYLAFNDNTFKVVKKLGFIYDCSREEGWSEESDGKNFIWPNKIDEIWNMPCYPVIIPPDDLCEKYGVEPGFRKSKVGIGPDDEPYSEEDGKITGLDYNMLVSYKMNKKEFLATLKYTFDLRMEGNRCPMLFGAHSDFYDESFDLAPNITPKEMREVVTGFLEYVSSFEVSEIVSYKKVIDYLNTI